MGPNKKIVRGKELAKVGEKCKKQRDKADAVPVKSSDGLNIIFTSGTAGLPKGVLREAGGHAIVVEPFDQIFIRGFWPRNFMFCASDIGWVVRTLLHPLRPFTSRSHHYLI